MVQESLWCQRTWNESSFSKKSCVDRKTEKLFDRFERFDNNTLSHEEGTGIGLNIVKQMVDALAGKIKAESEVDKGTTITITLPISKNLNLHKHNNYGDLNRRAELELSDI